MFQASTTTQTPYPTRRRAAVARRAHNPEVARSTRAGATTSHEIREQAYAARVLISAAARHRIADLIAGKA